MQESVILEFRENQFLERVNNMKKRLPFIQEAVDFYNGMSFGPLQPSEFHQLFSKPTDLFYAKITKDGPVTVGGHPIKKDRIFDFIEAPKGYNRMLQLVEETVAQMLREGGYFWLWKSVNEIAENLELDESGKVQIKQTTIDVIRKENQDAINSADAILLHEVAQEFLKILEDKKALPVINKHYRTPDKIQGFMKEILIEEPELKTPIINKKSLLIVDGKEIRYSY